MGLSLLRCVCLIAATLLVCASSNSYGRGPGGPGGGGPGGGRTGGGAGARGQDRSKPDADKKDSSKFKTNGLKTNDGPNTAKKLDGKPGNFKNGEFSPQQFQTREHPGQQNWQPGNNKFQQTPQNAFHDLKNGPQPFSADWYAAHPNAWQSTHQHADAWAAASAAGVAAWLGGGAQPTYTTSNTVVYQQATAEESDSTDDADTSADNTEWLSIGVYSVLAKSGEPTSRLLQLSCNRQSELRGVEYDSTTGDSQNLSGRIDQSTQIAEWQLDSNTLITFRANLSDLTQATGTIEVTQHGSTQQWRIARQESGS